MADFDSADLLSRLQTVTGRPANDQDLTSTKGYQFLSSAQRRVASILAQHVPWTNYTAPALMTTSDGGFTYAFAGNADALACEIYAALGDTPLREGPYSDPTADYTLDGSAIRMTGNVARSFPNGAPYARVFAKPTKIDGSTQPTLLPTDVREAVVYYAAALWAESGGYRDPLVYERRANTLLWGEGDGGAGGFIPAEKRKKDDGFGNGGVWWRGIR